MKILQYQNFRGDWIDCGENYINRAENFISNNPSGKILLDGCDTVLAALAAGKTVPTGTDWYNLIRYKPESTPTVKPILIKCDCGHTVSKILVMNTSSGTSCPDCYDSMSK